MLGARLWPRALPRVSRGWARRTRCRARADVLASRRPSPWYAPTPPLPTRRPARRRPRELQRPSDANVPRQASAWRSCAPRARWVRGQGSTSRSLAPPCQNTVPGRRVEAREQDEEWPIPSRVVLKRDPPRVGPDTVGCLQRAECGEPETTESRKVESRGWPSLTWPCIARLRCRPSRVRN